MSETTEPLVLDLVEWVAKQPKPYAEVIDAWRTSCPRLTVWEDAVERGYVVHDGGTVAATPSGLAFLRARGRMN